MVPVVEDRTGFAHLPVFCPDGHGRQGLTVAVKATWTIGREGRLIAVSPQPPLVLEGTWFGEPGISSPRLAPDLVPLKPATDVVLIGHACASRVGATEGMVSLAIGGLAKSVRVVGDRHFVKRLFGIGISDPLPFERIPLTWEHAFGGWDRSDLDPLRHTFDGRNPVGRGYRGRGAKFVEGVHLPNLEDPKDPLRSWAKPVTPAGFGFVDSGWMPRAAQAGTYDQRWLDECCPDLPEDFDPRFHCAGATGMTTIDGWLRGDELCLVQGVHADGDLAFALPNQPSPDIRVVRRMGGDLTTSCRLDTVIIDAGQTQVSLVWRATFLLNEGPLEVDTIIIAASEGMPHDVDVMTAGQG